VHHEYKFIYIQVQQFLMRIFSEMRHCTCEVGDSANKTLLWGKRLMKDTVVDYVILLEKGPVVLKCYFC